MSAKLVEELLRTGARDLHSGLYGGAALNAVHALHRVLAALLPGSDGRLPAPLRAGVIAPSERERGNWAGLPAGAHELERVGARPADAQAADCFYARTTAEPSLDVHGIDAGEAPPVRTIIPATARATLTLRLASGQSSAPMTAALERLARQAAPPGTDVTMTVHGQAEPAWFDPQTPALRLARDAIERACGRSPVLVRSGGTIPILAVFAQRGIPCVLSGFALPEDAIHAPNESFALDSLRLGERSAHELYRALAKLPMQGRR